MTKLIAMVASGLLGLGSAALLSAEPQRRDDDPPPPKKKGDPAKEKGERPGPGAGELRKAYDLLRRIKSDGDGPGRPEEKLRDWTERAAGIYRRAIQAEKEGDPRRARELGLAAHDLARAVDHARNAARLDRPDPDLPPPPGPRDRGGRGPLRKELRKSYDRVREMREEVEEARDGKFYLDATRDLYNAARSDAEADRPERAIELARAAEAMTHVPEHLARAWGGDRDRGPEPKAKRDRGPDPKAKRDDGPDPKAKGDRPEAKAKPEPPDDEDDDGELPPPLPR